MAEASYTPREYKCRSCSSVLVPPDTTRKYRTIKCNGCKEVTAVGPPPTDKKYVLCSCNALLIVDDDALIFTCTRCKKIRKASEVQTPRGDYGMATSRSQAFGISRSHTVGTIRNTLFRTVSTREFDDENPSIGLEAANGAITPKGTPAMVEPFRPNVEGVPDIGLEEIKLQEDQQYIVDFFSERIRTSVIAFFEGDKFWLMRLKTLIFVIYNVVISCLVISGILQHDFWIQFGFTTFSTGVALAFFIWFIISFTIEWVFNKIFVFGYIIMLVYYAIWAIANPLKRDFFWNFYDTGHLLDEVMVRSFYLRIPKLQVPVYRFFNPPTNSQIESEFFYFSDIHLISLVFRHPRIHKFFKTLLGISIFFKLLGKISCVAAIVVLPLNAYTLFYAGETFLSSLWMIFFYLVSRRKGNLV